MNTRRYLLAVVIPVILQFLFVFIVIKQNTGNGSWVGLGAFLIAMIAVPATAMVNIAYVASNKDRSTWEVVLRGFAIAALMPVLTVAFLVLG